MQSQNEFGANVRPSTAAGSTGRSRSANPPTGSSATGSGAFGADVPLKPQDRPTPDSDRGVVDQASQVAGQVLDKTQETTGQVMDQVRQQANARLSGQIDQGSEMLSQTSRAMSQVGEQLRQQDQPMLAGYADQLAGRVEQAASYLRGKDLDQIVDEAERLAHRQPALFVGGAFALGLLAARFLKSGSPRGASGGQHWSDTSYQPRFGYPNYGAGTSASSSSGYGTEATRGPGSYGASYQPRRASAADQPYPSGATGGAEPEPTPGYTPTV